MKNKLFRVCFAIIIAIISISTSVGAGWGSVKPQKRAKDATGAISMSIPQGWIQSKNNIIGSKLILLGPTVNGVTININMVTERSGRLSLSEYKKLTEKSTPKILNNFRQISSRPTTLGGAKAQEMVYTATVGTPAHDLKFKAVYALKSGNAYVFTFTSSVTDYDSYVKTFDSALSTVKWLQKGHKVANHSRK